MRTKGRHLDQLNQPSAIVEMKLGPASTEKAWHCNVFVCLSCAAPPSSLPQVEEVVRFELDSDKLSQLLSQVEDIQRAVDKHMHV